MGTQGTFPLSGVGPISAQTFSQRLPRVGGVWLLSTRETQEQTLLQDDAAFNKLGTWSSSG